MEWFMVGHLWLRAILTTELWGLFRRKTEGQVQELRAPLSRGLGLFSAKPHPRLLKQSLLLGVVLSFINLKEIRK